MAKVVTERPRRGHANPSKKTGKRLSKDEFDKDDHGSTRAPVSRKRQYGYDAKGFTDVLGPLRGYLKKQVGRPWNKVFSELSQFLDKRSITGQHIFDHVKWEIILNVRIGDDGIIYEYPARYGYLASLGNGTLYVHPVTGLVALAKHPDKSRGPGLYSRNWKDVPRNIFEITLADRTTLRQDDESLCWFHERIETIMDTQPVFEDGKQVRVTPKKILKLVKKSLNTRELKAYGLKNGVVITALPDELTKLKAKVNRRW